jgi:HD-GYP domain-containing protein (c-di-GMP phosphodiesterase class II)
MLKRITLDQLKVGMYVAGIDGSWFKTPFLKHRFLIDTVEQIERLRRSSIRAVDIDTAKGIDVISAPTADETIRISVIETSAQAPPASDIPRSLDGLSLELSIAQEVRDKLVQAVKSAFEDIRKTGVIAQEPINRTVQETIVITRARSTHSMFRAVSQERPFDTSLSDHSLTVCMLATIMGKALGYDSIQLNELATGALLHDVGLLQLPSQLVHPATPLSGKDLATFCLHPPIGSIMIEAQPAYSQTVCRIANEHHVTLDGKGYPPETSPESTTESSRIVMVVDRYDELRTEFGGLRPLSSHVAIQQLFQEGELGRLDSRLVSLFIKLVGIYPVYSVVELNTKERGVITTINPDTLHQPEVVKMSVEIS